MSKTKITRTPEEFDMWINSQMKHLIEDCQALGINNRNIPKTKVLKLLRKRLIEDEEKNKKNYLSLL